VEGRGRGRKGSWKEGVVEGRCRGRKGSWKEGGGYWFCGRERINGMWEKGVIAYEE